MYIFDVTNPITLTLLLVITLLLTFLGKEIKKPHAPAYALIFFLLLIVMHSMQLAIAPNTIDGIEKGVLSRCIGVDFVFIFVSFFSYLWVDDIACKFYKKKSIDNSLDWFWNNV